MNFRTAGLFRMAGGALALVACAVSVSPAAVFDFAILGDRTGNAVPGIYEEAVQEVASQHPAFVINVGDTIQGLNDSTVDAEWEAMRAVWKSFHDTPFYLVAGNHDIWSPVSEAAWRHVTHRAPQYSFDFHGAHITVLDNSRTADLAPEQLQFLETDLAAHAEQQPKFIFFHRPFWLFAVKFQNGGFPLHQLARKYHAGFVVSGHVHEFDRSEFQGVQYIMVGSSGGSLSHGERPAAGPNRLEGLYFGYAWVHVDGAAARLDFRKLKDQSGEGKRMR